MFGHFVEVFVTSKSLWSYGRKAVTSLLLLNHSGSQHLSMHHDHLRWRGKLLWAGVHTVVDRAVGVRYGRDYSWLQWACLAHRSVLY
jgi:hypothetical protein